MVGRTSCNVGAHNNQTVRFPGSSIAFNKALAADSVRRPAAHRRRPGDPGEQFSNLFDLDRKAFGSDDFNVWMAAVEGAAALITRATALIGAYKGLCEGYGGR